MPINFDGQVAIVTGAGTGLGRAHALGLAAHGARVLVTDLGEQQNGSRRPSAAAVAVADEITAHGGEAFAVAADVSDPAQVDAAVAETMRRWGRVDVLVNNAGILRDRTFRNMTPDEFDHVMAVHVRGSFNCTKAVWDIMRAQNYGRILFTSSSSGLFGNFGQTNYGTAKAAMVGLMNVLHLEGEKYGIRVNTLAPAANTAMTRDLMSPEALAAMVPEAVTPGVLYLVSRDAPSKVILGAGGGAFAVIHILESPAVFLPEDVRTPDEVARRMVEISSLEGAAPVERAGGQSRKFLHAAQATTAGAASA